MSVGGFLCRGFLFGAPFFYDCFCSKKARAADQGTTRYEQRTKIKIKKSQGSEICVGQSHEATPIRYPGRCASPIRNELRRRLRGRVRGSERDLLSRPSLSNTPPGSRVPKWAEGTPDSYHDVSPALDTGHNIAAGPTAVALRGKAKKVQNQ